MLCYNGVGKLKEIVAIRDEEAEPEAVENHFRFLRLLERYGLTRVEILKHIHLNGELLLSYPVLY